ncbi:sensor histidine kinase [Devosia sp. Root685]|uniref:sensor histidine kinase n=1 Tax=Devosia sp. Root685 TaxID=1736587 RepID=UPI000AC19AC2|nr:CHASE3 domain-containing protein [Devosia sp. Root685]
MSVVAQRVAGSQTSVLGRRTARRIAIWVSLVLVCLAAVVSLLLMQGMDRQLRDITDTYAVRDTARELVNVMSQAEASQRGYMLTRDAKLLEPYHAAAARVDAYVKALLDMTADDAAQAERMRSITGDIAGRMAEMARTIELVATARQEEAQSLIETGMGARLMSDVRDTFEAFIAEENQKLVLRNEGIDRSRVWLVGTIIVALAAAVCLAYALMARTQKQVSAMVQRHRGLINQNEALEAEIVERTRAIEEARAHAERERQRVEALLQDTSHRIGNSLATVSSLLALQLMRTRSAEVRTALEAARLRVHAIASAHRRLRLGDDMESASAEEFLSAVLEDIALTQTDSGRIAIEGKIESIEVSARDATTLGILVGEFVTNALKHGFPDGRSGRVEVVLFRDEAGVPTLKVSDNGVGLPEGQDEGGLGSVIIRQLSSQFGGEPVYVSVPGEGVTISVSLPALDRTPAPTNQPAME